MIFSVFWYMIGEFPYYEVVQFPDPQRSACLEAVSRTPMGYGSSQLVHWINNVRLTPPPTRNIRACTPAAFSQTGLLQVYSTDSQCVSAVRIPEPLIVRPMMSQRRSRLLLSESD